jgi:hypothetical protein
MNGKGDGDGKGAEDDDGGAVPWSTEAPGDDRHAIDRLSESLAAAVRDPSGHVRRLREMAELLEELPEMRGNPAGPGGPIEVLRLPSGDFGAVVADELVCRAEDLDDVREVLARLRIREVEVEVDDRVGLGRIVFGRTQRSSRPASRSAGVSASAVQHALRRARLNVGLNDVTIEGWRVKADISPEPSRRELGNRPDGGAGRGITVGIVDGGFPPVADEREDGWLDGIADPAVSDTLDISGDGLDPGAGHGTFVAGVVRQEAPACDVRLYRAANSMGFGNSWTLKDAILRAVDDGCDVINLSLGFEPAGGEHGSHAVTACLRSIPSSVLVVAAAGNGGSPTPMLPASLKGVIGVAALDRDLEPAEWTDHGPWVDFSCVGEGVLSTFVVGTEEDDALPTSTDFAAPDPIALWAGTSFAAPQVAGRLAKLRSQGLSPADAVDALRDQARAFFPTPHPDVGFRMRIL